jgi:hypothetical protein
VFRTPPQGGLRFSHSLHLPEERKTLNKGCEGCHERKAASARFEPISFDAHCASCHVKNGALDQIRQKTDRPHRDPNTIDQASALARLVDLDALTAERAAVVDRIAEAERLVAAGNSNASATPDRAGQRRERAQEWASKGIEPVVPKPAPHDLADRGAIDSLLVRLRRRLTQLDAVPPPLPSPAPAEGARQALASLLTPCLACHEASGASLRPVTAARPVLTAASFNHEPHVTAGRQTCESCHDTNDRSGRALDVNLPHVAKCQTCHGIAPEAPTACSSCHQYHRRPGARLSAWTPAGSF